MVMTISGTSGVTFPDASTQASGQQVCKAWVDFNGSTNTIKAAYNVGSITKNGTGDFTLNFTTPMADANYCYSGCGVGQNFSNDILRLYLLHTTSGAITLKTASQMRVMTGFSNAAYDTVDSCFTVYR